MTAGLVGGRPSSLVLALDWAVAAVVIVAVVAAEIVVAVAVVVAVVFAGVVGVVASAVIAVVYVGVVAEQAEGVIVASVEFEGVGFEDVVEDCVRRFASAGQVVEVVGEGSYVQAFVVPASVAAQIIEPARWPHCTERRVGAWLSCRARIAVIVHWKR